MSTAEDVLQKGRWFCFSDGVVRPFPAYALEGFPAGYTLEQHAIDRCIAVDDTAVIVSIEHDVIASVVRTADGWKVEIVQN